MNSRDRVGLYSYLGARICLLSLLCFLVWDGLYRRERSILKHGIAFATGAGTIAFPLFCYYGLKPAAFWMAAKKPSKTRAAISCARESTYSGVNMDRCRSTGRI